MDTTEARAAVEALPDMPARKDVARLMGVSVRTVIRMEERGLLAPMRLSASEGGRVLYTRRSVADMLTRISGE